MSTGNKQIEALLLERMRRRRVVPFIGAGLALPHLPSWEGLLKLLWCATRPDQASHFKAAFKRKPTAVAEFIKLGTQKPLVALVHEHLEGRLAATPAQAGHRAVMAGPWPAVITTNWDDLLEQAWDQLVAEPHRPSFKRLGPVEVRYRKASRDVFAIVKAARWPPPVLKLHGDFTEKGKNEFVFGHGEYRDLMVRDVDTRALLGHLASEYSLLFYGTSLSDPDLLTTLDAVHEALGPAVGPHFWLTVEKDTSPPEKEYFRRHYGIHTLAHQEWEDVVASLVNLGSQAWSASTPISSFEQEHDGLKLRLARTPIRPEDLEVDQDTAVAVTVACVNGRVHRPGGPSMLGNLLGAAVGDVSKIAIEPGGVAPWQDGRRRAWLVCGQESGGWGRTGLVHRAVTAFLESASQAGARTFRMPLIARGGGGLLPHETLGAQLHAIGCFAATRRREGAAVEVEILIPTGDPAADPMVDVAEGRLIPGRVLERAAAGLLACTVVHPDPLRDKAVVVSPVVVPADGTIGDLVAAVDLDARSTWTVERVGGRGKALRGSPGDLSAALIECDVTDGSTVRLEPSRAVRP